MDRLALYLAPFFLLLAGLMALAALRAKRGHTGPNPVGERLWPSFFRPEYPRATVLLLAAGGFAAYSVTLLAVYLTGRDSNLARGLGLAARLLVIAPFPVGWVIVRLRRPRR